MMQSHANPRDEAFSDEMLVALFRKGDSSALEELFRRYLPLAKSRAARYRYPGVDAEDLVQEGMIGLFKAIRHFDPARQVPFRSFAFRCVSNQVSSAARAALNQKDPLWDYTSLSSEYEDESLAGCQEDPQATLAREEELAALRGRISSLLSAFEKETLQLYLCGYSYQDMASLLGCTPKAVDNSIQRVRRKLKSAR